MCRWISVGHGELWVAIWSSVHINGGVNWVRLLFWGDLGDNGCCLGIFEVEIAKMKVLFMIDIDVLYMFVGISCNWEGVRVDIVSNFVF